MIDSTKREIRSCNLIATLYINIMICTVVPITAVTEFLMTLSLIRTVQLRGLNEGDVSADSTVTVPGTVLLYSDLWDLPPKK